MRKQDPVWPLTFSWNSEKHNEQLDSNATEKAQSATEQYSLQANDRQSSMVTSAKNKQHTQSARSCLLYTSDAADES